MSAVKALLSALPSAASNPLALVAYALLVSAWVAISLKVNRNKHLLANLEKLPEGDRLQALELEMGAVRMKAGLTANEWIRSRIHLYYFLGFVLLCAVVVIVFAIAATTRREDSGTVTADLSLNNRKPSLAAPSSLEVPAQNASDPQQYSPNIDRASETRESRRKVTGPGPEQLGGGGNLSQTLSASGAIRALTVKSDFDQSGGMPPYAPPDLTVSYHYMRTERGVAISPVMPYLDLLAMGGPIKGFHYWWSPFAWQYPGLSVEIVNNTKNTMFFNELVVRVNGSQVNREPVLLVEENFYNVGNFDLINEGWGNAVNPTLDFDILPVGACDQQPSMSGTSRHIAIEPISDRSRIKIAPLVPDSLHNETLVCVAGNIRYENESHARRAIKFSTRVSLVPPGPGAPAPPSYLYDLFLEAGKSGYTTRVPIAQKIAAQDVDHFLLRIGTDKSAHFELNISLRRIGGAELAMPPVFLDIFVPRSQSQEAHQSTRLQ